MKLGDKDPIYYNSAIEYLMKHLQLASDNAGKFLAHVNLSIIYNKINDYKKASINHQMAVKYAMQMNNQTMP